MRFAIITLLLISMAGCMYPFFANAAMLTIDLVIIPSTS
jgi:hypothetical protein